jgi:hypothetical protein
MNLNNWKFFVMMLGALLHNGNSDKWSYIWGSDFLTTKQASLVLMYSQPAPPHFNWVWNYSCQSKHKFFFWLLLQDRLNTRNVPGRKMASSLLCVCKK